MKYPNLKNGLENDKISNIYTESINNFGNNITISDIDNLSILESYYLDLLGEKPNSMSYALERYFFLDESRNLKKSNIINLMINYKDSLQYLLAHFNDDIRWDKLFIENKNRIGYSISTNFKKLIINIIKKYNLKKDVLHDKICLYTLDYDILKNIGYKPKTKENHYYKFNEQDIIIDYLKTRDIDIIIDTVNRCVLSDETIRFIYYNIIKDKKFGYSTEISTNLIDNHKIPDDILDGVLRYADITSLSLYSEKQNIKENTLKKLLMEFSIENSISINYYLLNNTTCILSDDFINNVLIDELQADWEELVESYDICSVKILENNWDTIKENWNLFDGYLTESLLNCNNIKVSNRVLDYLYNNEYLARDVLCNIVIERKLNNKFINKYWDYIDLKDIIPKQYYSFDLIENNPKRITDFKKIMKDNILNGYK